jgi:hypothetical protein
MSWRGKSGSEESAIQRPGTRLLKRMLCWAKKTSALRVLRTSVDSGFFSYPYIAKDPVLSDLHNEPVFAPILNIVRQRYEAFRSSFVSGGDHVNVGPRSSVG